MDVKNNPLLKQLMILLLCFCLKADLSHAADMITGNQSISGDETIVSSAGNFTLGFFQPDGNSSKYYIGSWFNRVSPQTIVWVANRETPVSDKSSSVLKIAGGNLVLFNESSYPIWSTNLTSTNSSSVEAVLGDDGNLVLQDGSNSSDALWQSFDHPTDTWLPGAKIGLNKRTGKTTRLTSWKSKTDPTPGIFSVELDPKGTNQYFLLWNSTRQYWTSGPWNEQTKTYENVPEMRLSWADPSYLVRTFRLKFVDDDNESYFTYNTSLICRATMDWSGQVQATAVLDDSKQWFIFWSKPKLCETYAYCGPYGSCNENSKPFCQCLKGFDPKDQNNWNSGAFSGGCRRRTNLQCENPGLLNGKRDRFFPIYNVKLPDNNQTAASGSQRECQSTCLSNCNCTAYNYDNRRCLLWYGDILDLQQLTEGDSDATTLYLKLAASEFSSNKTNEGIVVGAVIGSILVVLLFGLLLFVVMRRKRAIELGKVGVGSLMAFGYRDLQNATKNFSEKLGGGGFGSVFKGVLPDSSVIAVKMLESISQGEKQFRTEVSTIGTIQHVNLVRLRGFCSEGTRKLLVYDYMPNGSLGAHVFQEKDSNVVDWKKRYNIAVGIARGLHYLHEKCRDCIIHCDIKPENILLDAEFGPKVADFGLAKLVGREFSRVLTTMRGTRGYLAPEWISGVAITAKADVYSYGMMLFEIVSGRRNLEQSDDGRMRFFPTWATNVLTEGGDAMSILDPWLEGNADVEEVVRVCKVACWCIQDDETQRPSMGQVVQILEGDLDVTMPPIPRSLQVFVDNQEQVIFFMESSSASSSQTRCNNSTPSFEAQSTPS